MDLEFEFTKFLEIAAEFAALFLENNHNFKLGLEHKTWKCKMHWDLCILRSSSHFCSTGTNANLIKSFKNYWWMQNLYLLTFHMNDFNFYFSFLANMVEFGTTIGEFPINTSSSEIWIFINCESCDWRCCPIWTCFNWKIQRKMCSQRSFIPRR